MSDDELDLGIVRANLWLEEMSPSFLGQCQHLGPGRQLLSFVRTADQSQGLKF